MIDIEKNQVNISFDDFRKLDIRMARIVSAERLEGSEKLIRITADTGEGERILLAGLAPYYAPENIIGKCLPVLCNLEPRKIRGELSCGMILAADAGGVPVILESEKPVPPGSIVR